MEVQLFSLITKAKKQCMISTLPMLCFYYLQTSDVLIQVLHMESKENNVITSYQLCLNQKNVNTTLMLERIRSYIVVTALVGAKSCD